MDVFCLDRKELETDFMVLSSLSLLAIDELHTPINDLTVIATCLFNREISQQYFTSLLKTMSRAIERKMPQYSFTSAGHPLQGLETRSF